MDEHTRDPGVAPPLGDPTGWHAAGGEPNAPEAESEVANSGESNRDEEDREVRLAGGYWEHATLRRATEHGVRLFNSGEYHESLRNVWPSINKSYYQETGFERPAASL